MERSFQRSPHDSDSEINSPKKSKPPKFLIKQPQTTKGILTTTNDFDSIAKNTMSIRKVPLKDTFSRTYLLPPCRKESERNDSTNLSHSNLVESYRGSIHCQNRPTSLIILEEGLDVEDFDLDEGDVFKRNAVTKTSAFIKYSKKYSTNNQFTDFVNFREYQQKRLEQKSELNQMVKSRLPEKKVLSMKEYRNGQRGRARTVSPKKPILSAKRKTITGTKGFEVSPARKQVTFSKTNTVLIFVKEDHSSKHESLKNIENS